MFIYRTTKFAPARTNILEIVEIFVHLTLTDHALSEQHYTTMEMKRLCILVVNGDV